MDLSIDISSLHKTMQTDHNMTDQNKQSIPTGEFLRRLFKSNDLNTFIKYHADEMEQIPFHIYISNICKSEGQVPEQVIKRSGIERTYGHQLFNGTRNPSRDKVIQLAFGLELDVAGTQNLLKAAQMNSLYPKIKRDAVILYCIENKKGFFETQGALQTLDLTLLGGKKNG